MQGEEGARAERGEVNSTALQALWGWVDSNLLSSSHDRKYLSIPAVHAPFTVHQVKQLGHSPRITQACASVAEWQQAGLAPSIMHAINGT